MYKKKMPRRFVDPHAPQADDESAGTELHQTVTVNSARQRRLPHTFEKGFQLFLQRIETFKPDNQVEITELDRDVDFAFIVARNAPKVIDSGRPGRQYFSDEVAVARRAYLDELRETYRISYKIVEGDEYDYYLIHLTFAHLGLLAEILRYPWQMKTTHQDKKVFESLTFFKWFGSTNEEYDCRSRSDFSEKLRFDLAFQFLVGAAVTVNSPEQRTANNCGCCRAIESRPTQYDLMKVMSDRIFDDWMIPHTSLNYVPPPSRLKDACPGCVPCIEGCQLIVTSKTLSYDPRQPGENVRNFLFRYCTFKSALTRQRYPSSDHEKRTGANLRHLIPVHDVAEYVGEKIGFYFAWAELLIMTMLIPAIIGLAMFLIVVAYQLGDVYYNSNKTVGSDTDVDIVILYAIVKACDNYGTPAFALIMIIWGTSFREVWLRREAWYRHFWNVENLEVNEIERELGGYRTSGDAISIDRPSLRSSLVRTLKYTLSAITTICFICLIFISVYVINVIKLFSFDYCPTAASFSESETSDSAVLSAVRSQQVAAETTSLWTRMICQLFGAAQVVTNSISVFILDLIFTRVAYKLTDWEAHSTLSGYSHYLALKLFTFRFFNYYTILFFTAFASNILTVRSLESLLPEGAKTYEYSSIANARTCGAQPCLFLLTKQLLGILITQPLFDIIFGLANPTLKWLWKYITRKLTCNRYRIDSSKGNPGHQHPAHAMADELDRQNHLPHLSPLGRQQFEVNEFTQRIIVFGALLMFSVALPPASAITITFLRVDLTLDIRRIITRYKRVVPHRANGIGVWDKAVNLLTYLGIITNPLIVILTSSWGSQFDTWWKFWVFIIFEHFAVAVRAIVAVAIPDVPARLEREQLRRNIARQQIITEMATKKRRR